MCDILDNKAWKKIKKSNSKELCLVTLDALKNLGLINDAERAVYLEDLLRGMNE